MDLARIKGSISRMGVVACALVGISGAVYGDGSDLDGAAAFEEAEASPMRTFSCTKPHPTFVRRNCLRSVLIDYVRNRARVWRQCRRDCAKHGLGNGPATTGGGRTQPPIGDLWSFVRDRLLRLPATESCQTSLTKQSGGL